jgi:large subunit ribosomal protein L32
MAVPFRRTSKTAKRLRRGHFKLNVTGLVTCPHCGALIQAHHVCPECGFYDGKDVLHLSKEKGEPAKK